MQRRLRYTTAIVVTALAFASLSLAEARYQDSYSTPHEISTESARMADSISKVYGAVFTVANSIDPSLPGIPTRFANLSGTVAEEGFQQRLDYLVGTIGAHGVSIQIVPAPCGLAALGCVFSLDASVIQIAAEAQSYTDRELRGLLAHEYAHVLQSRLSAFRVYSPGYLGEYGYDVEWNADCMAVALVGYTTSFYGYECSVHQIEVAKNLWQLDIQR